MSPLHLAVYFSQDDVEKWQSYEKVISLLLSTPIIGNDINQKDGLQRTALHWAAIRGFEKCIRFLLKHGAELSTKLSLKLLIILQKICQVIQTLYQDVYGWTPLHYAIEFNLLGGGGFDLYKSLISPKNVNIQNDGKLQTFY